MGRMPAPLAASLGLSLREFAMKEPLPLATIHQAVLEFLAGRNDAVVFGAQAVNAYVDEPRMTQDVDVMSPRPAQLADEIRDYLASRFHAAIRVREVAHGRGFRVFQVRKEGAQHLVGVRAVAELPESRRLGNVAVITPVELVASKVLGYHSRLGTPKAGTDWRDLAMLLLAFPDLKRNQGAVRDRLVAQGAEQAVLDLWLDLASQDIRPGSDDDV